MLKKLFTSRTILGAAGLALSMVTRAAGLDLDEGQITEYATRIVDVAGLVFVIIGRLRAKGPLI